LEPEFKPDLPGEAQITLADISKASALGWKPKTDLRTGIMRSIEYIKKEFEEGRIK
jgi:nucleoside-diphosphate-sugar epimerase